MQPNDETQALPIATAADIAQIYDAYAQLPKPDPADPNPTLPHPDPADAPMGALPAAFEYDGLHGRIILPLEAVPSATLLAHPSVAAQVQGGVQTIKFDEQSDGNWCIYLQGDDIHSGARFALATAELDAMLARDGAVLYGRPTPEELAALRQNAGDDSADAPPF